MSDTSHKGTCAFCGSTVDRSFSTCKGCGATWRTVVNGWGALTVQAALPVGLVVGIFAGVAMQNLLLLFVTAFGAMIAMFAWGTSMRTSAWFR